MALALQTRALPAVLMFWFVYLARGVAGSPVETLLNQAVPSRARAALLSVASLATYVGFFVGSVALGGLAERVSVGAAWGLAGAVLTLSLAVYGGLEDRRVPGRPNDRAPEAGVTNRGASESVQALDGRV